MLSLLRHIVYLEKAVGSFAPTKILLAEDLSLSEERLNIVALQHLARRMACFINMPFFNIIVTPAKQKESVAGHVEGCSSDSEQVFIEIDPDYLNYPVAAIKVLAHEIAHKYLAFHRLELDSVIDNEILTDVTAIYLGFGVFALNGGEYTDQGGLRAIKNGYLNLNENAFVYDVVCSMRGFSDEKTFQGLNREAVKSIFYVRKSYAPCYPLNKNDFLSIKNKISDIHQRLESSDLEFCNIDKIKVLFPGALATKVQEINSVRADMVKTRRALLQLENEMESSVGNEFGLSIPFWLKDVEKLALSSYNHLSVVSKLNDFVSKRVPEDITSESWNAMTSLVIKCPQCAGRMRLPTNKGLMNVLCPKCKYSFDYSTTCPKFEWVQSSPIRERHSFSMSKILKETMDFLRDEVKGVPKWIWGVLLWVLYIIISIIIRPYLE